MEQKTHSQKFLRQRKFLMVLPLLVLPFLTLMFWVLGGGKVNDADAQQAQNGLNMQLPGANLKDDKPLDKLSYYEKAASDSLKLQQLMESDPYYQRHENTDTSVLQRIDTSLMDVKYSTNRGTRKSSTLNHNSTYGDPNETKVYQKLAQLDAALNKASSQGVNSEDNISTVNPVHNTSVNSSDIDRLEQMMQGMNQKGDDPEMQQLSGMLEKILDIQHPERVKDRIKEKSLQQKQAVFTVSKNSGKDNISLLDTTKREKITGTGFYGIDDNVTEEENNNAIEAVVHTNQVLVNGAVIKLRLSTDVYINGTLIPKDNFVFGIASLNNERLEIEINSIRNNKSLFPVKMEVYDMDGLPGIYIPGAITRDVAKQSADNSLQLMEITSMDPSLKAQAAATGITAAKNLLSKKIKQIKVTVKAGYKVLLKDKNIQQ